jgi:DNA-binding beta-propeller fold protein YncE
VAPGGGGGGEGTLYFTEFGSNSVRALDLASGATRTLATGLRGPWGMDVAPDGGSLVVADSYNNRVVVVPLL